MRIAGDRLGEEIYRFIEPSDPQEHDFSVVEKAPLILAWRRVWATRFNAWFAGAHGQGRQDDRGNEDEAS